MKKLTTLMTALLIIIVLIGCNDNRHEENYVDNGQHTAVTVELLDTDLHYNVRSFNLDIDIDFTQIYFFIYQEQLYVFLQSVDEDTLNSYIHLFSMNADGTNMREIYRTLLDESVDFFNIFGFEKHEDGYISIVSTDSVILPPHTRENYLVYGLWDFDIDYSYVYRRVSPAGEILTVLSVDALDSLEQQFRISDVIFDLDENAAALVSWLPAGGEHSSLFLFNSGLSGDFIEIEEQTFSHGLLNRTYDGQIIKSSREGHHEADMIMFYEVDFENVAIVDGLVIGANGPINRINGVFPASEASEFDYYFIVNDQEFIGYRKSDETFTLLIDFQNLGVPFNYGRLHRNNFLLWDDGRITTVNISWNSFSGRDEATVFLITPITEQDMVIEREIITFGGVFIEGSPLIDKIAVFNRQSDTHQIEVVNYTFDDMDRLRTELIAGRGPDIFATGWLTATMYEGLFMLDLYPLIDSDPDITREDFFPSILSAWENSSGELVSIAPGFRINTIVGMQSVFPEAPKNWNYADFIAFYEDAMTAGYDDPLGLFVDRQEILFMLLFSDDTFFCEQTAVANFDSESFINVLNFVKPLPVHGWERVPEEIRFSGQWDSLSELIIGEQLLSSENISHTESFRELQMRLGGITAFGLPSNNAPIHAVWQSEGVGIRSNSPHIEAAWEFVRLSLLPGNLNQFHDRIGFLSRIDQFEQQIAREVSRVGPTERFFPHGSIKIDPMTESDAELLREIISNVGLSAFIGHPVRDIINEDVHAFFEGARSAEDTARVIQSRVERFLSERAR